MNAPLSRRAWLAAGALMPQAAGGAETVRLPKKVRVGLIGLDGHIGEILGPLGTLPDVAVTALADPDPAAMARVARAPRVAGARRYSDYRQLLENEPLEIAAVCGANGVRSEVILRAIARGLHVVAEKPLAIESKDLESIRRALDGSRVRLTMLLPMRFWGTYRAMRRIVESGAIGEVAQMGAQKSYKLGDRPDWMRHYASFGGTIPYIGIHMVDLMRFTSSRELVEAASFQGRVGFPELADMENTTATVFRLDNGGTASLHMDYLRPETAPSHGDDRLRLAGTRGVVEYQEQQGLTIVTDRAAPRAVTDIPANRSLFVDFLESVYAGKPAGLAVPDIFRANEIVLAARQSAVERRMISMERHPAR